MMEIRFILESLIISLIYPGGKFYSANNYLDLEMNESI